MTSVFDVVALLLVLAAAFGWFNRRFLRLSNSVGLLLMGLLASVVLGGIETIYPENAVLGALTDALARIDFTDVVLNGMLGFLLFAGAMNVDLAELRGRAGPVVLLAVFATVLSTLLIGFAFWGTARWLGHPLSIGWALVFGALISPTDPVALLSVLRSVEIPLALQIEMEGEALFNDGVSLVLFTVLVTFALGGGSGGALGIWEVARLFGVGVLGGLALGLAAGLLAYWAMRTVDDVTIEVLISLALVTATYGLAQKIGASGPLAVVAAGLLIGDWGPRDAMSAETQQQLLSFWRLVDEILNAVLFLLIGLDVIVLRFAPAGLAVAALAVPIVLAARFFSVSVPFLLFSWSRMLSAGNVPFLTWGGVRGGISVAMALALPEGAAKPTILAATYAVALFSIAVQGTTLGWVARKTLR